MLDSKYFESRSEEFPNIIPNKSDKVRASKFEKFLLILKLSFKNLSLLQERDISTKEIALVTSGDC